jgi:hypothetical protein
MPEPTAEQRSALKGLIATGRPSRRGAAAHPRKGATGVRSTASTIRLPWAVSYTVTGSGTSTSLWAPLSPASDHPPASAVEPVDGSVREPWVTKRELAAHLHVALRWIEAQHHHGLPHARRGGVLRYRISEVETWLRGEPATERGS